MKTINIEKIDELLSNEIAFKNSKLTSFELDNEKQILNTIKEYSYLKGFLEARNIIIEYLNSDEKYVEIGGEYTLDVGSSSPIKVKVLNILNNFVECEYLSSYNGRIENIGFALFEVNGYKFK